MFLSVLGLAQPRAAYSDCFTAGSRHHQAGTLHIMQLGPKARERLHSAVPSLHRARLPPTPSRCRPPCHQPPPRSASHQPPPRSARFQPPPRSAISHRPGRPAFSHRPGRPASAHNGPASGRHGTATGTPTRPGRLAFSYRPGRPASARRAFSSFVGKKHIAGRMACCCWDCPSPAKPSVRPQDRASSGHTAKYDCPCVPLALT